MFNNFFGNRVVYGIMWKNNVEPERPQVAIWCMCIACWKRKATNTPTEYVMLTAFPLHCGCTNSPQCYVIVQCPSSLFWPCRIMLLQRVFVFTLSHYVWPLCLHTIPYERTCWQYICTQSRICLQNILSTHYVQYPVPTVHCYLHPAQTVQCVDIRIPSHIHQLVSTVPRGLLHTQVIAIYKKLINVISYPLLRRTKDLKTLYFYHKFSRRWFPGFSFFIVVLQNVVEE